MEVNIMKSMIQSVLTMIVALAFISGMSFMKKAEAASAQAIDIKVDSALADFAKKVGGGKKFLEEAKGVLVFPAVLKAGFGIGGQYGEGALRVGGKSTDYYSIASASIGFQAGAQEMAIVIVFLEKNELDKFQRSEGWEVGVDGSVALVTLGAGASVDTMNIKDPVVGFVFNNKGLMYNLALQGTKITKLTK
jgi:lipid-binding SYLF domain-containing protein